MEYTGIFLGPENISSTGLHYKAQYRITVDTETIEQAFYQLSNLRFSDPVLSNSLRTEQTGTSKEWYFEFDFSRIESENRKSMMILHNGKSYRNEDIKKHMTRINGYDVVRPVLLDHEMISHAISKGWLGITGTDIQEGQPVLILSCGNDSTIIPFPESSAYDTPEEMKKDLLLPENKIKYISFVQDVLENQILAKYPYTYNAFKREIDNNTAQENEADQIQYADVFKGLRSGFIEYKESNTLMPYINIRIKDYNISFHIQSTSNNKTGSDGVALSVKEIEEVMDKLRKFPIEVQQEIRRAVYAHNLDKLPDSVISAALENTSEDFDKACVLYVEKNKDDSVCFVFNADEALSLTDVFEALNEKQMNELKDLLLPLKKKRLNCSLFNVSAWQNKVEDYTVLIDWYDVDSLIKETDKALENRNPDRHIPNGLSVEDR